MFATDILKVIYEPHKAFKKIIENPKYWGPLLVLVIFVAGQTALFFVQYSKTYYEETTPPIGQLTTWTDNSKLWTAQGAVISSDTNDILNTTFYGNTTLQFTTSNSSSISMILSDFNESINCGPNGYPELFLQIKFVEPSSPSSSANLRLFSLSSSNYFQKDLASTFSNVSTSEWNNYSIPVGSGAENWQTNGNPDWINITGLEMDMAFSGANNLTIRIGSLFFRGLYETPIEVFSTSGFAASASFSAVFSFIVQWIALSVVFYVIIKVFRGAVTWKPLFVAMAFALITMTIETFIILGATATLPGQIRYPYEFSIGYQLTYPSQIVSLFSAASQATYNSTIAMQIATYSSIVTYVAIAVYVWLTAIGATIVRVITEFTWMKSIITSAVSVVGTYILLSLLTAVGII